MKNIILIAPPGAGKGTQAKMLCDKYDMVHISVGDLLRKEVSENGPYAQQLEEKMSQGLLVDDELILKIMNQRLNEEDCEKGFILDGFPRNINQAILLDEMSKQIDYVIYLDVSKETLKNRIVGRVICPKCGSSFNTLIEESRPKKDNVCDTCGSQLEKRKDDSLETFEKRYDTYIKETEPILDYYKGKNNLYSISSTDKEEVFDTIKSILGV